ncbi:hypothetical protein J4E06_14965 [Muricauda sp. NFXS6]|uniref:hypothetical protein n=1 Tax=Allomuricauda sp. NFXS6 TaxID=2819094 RepID=UPI0032DEED60
MKGKFLEQWILDLVKSEYEYGKIPKHASYKLRERMDDFIEVTIEWMDMDNNSCKVVYHARAYGKMQVNRSLDIAKDPVFELENYYTLEIHTYINHVKRNYSTRKIANYDVMGVVGQLKKSGETS